jgi:hypothetical protein
MSIKNAVVLLLTVCIAALCFLYIKDKIASSQPRPVSYEIQSDSLNKLVDSLNQELFKKDVIIGKYDIALEILKESDPQAAITFETILKNKTE